MGAGGWGDEKWGWGLGPKSISLSLQTVASHESYFFPTLRLSALAGEPIRSSTGRVYGNQRRLLSAQWHFLPMLCPQGFPTAQPKRASQQAAGLPARSKPAKSPGACCSLLPGLGSKGRLGFPGGLCPFRVSRCVSRRGREGRWRKKGGDSGLPHSKNTSLSCAFLFVCFVSYSSWAGGPRGDKLIFNSFCEIQVR